jgi:hypothetical protein
VVSLVRLEFMPDRRKSFLLTALGLAVFTFSILALGQNVAGENEGVAELFTYADATGVLIFLELLMPPYRAGDWISRVREDRRRQTGVGCSVGGRGTAALPAVAAVRGASWASHGGPVWL